MGHNEKRTNFVFKNWKRGKNDKIFFLKIKIEKTKNEKKWQIYKVKIEKNHRKMSFLGDNLFFFIKIIKFRKYDIIAEIVKVFANR